ncbi:MAG TPA: hypothetical protein VK979_09590 [Guyparkeria sp.]|nr:hypothetical protein [Guyparkeria sp.]
MKKSEVLKKKRAEAEAQLAELAKQEREQRKREEDARLREIRIAARKAGIHKHDVERDLIVSAFQQLMSEQGIAADSDDDADGEAESADADAETADQQESDALDHVHDGDDPENRSGMLGRLAG